MDTRFKTSNPAKEAWHQAGTEVHHPFVDLNKMIILAKGAQRQVEDIALTSYACYLIAQNGEDLSRASGDAEYIAFKSGDLNERYFLYKK